MKTNKILVTFFWIALLGIFQITWAYEEVACTSNPIFSANTCNQCFKWGTKGEGDNIGLLSDDWVNDSNLKQIIYKEEQKFPFMINLSEGLVSWSQTPSAENFWEYTQEFEDKLDAKEEGYVLAPQEKVTWLKSKLWYAFALDKNQAPVWDPIGLLIYPIKPHNIMENGEITVEDTEHKECVLFTSAKKEAVTPPVAPKPKQLPKTWPEEMMIVGLLALALLTGFWLSKLTKKI